MATSEARKAPSLQSPCNIAMLADQLKLLALNATIETTAMDPAAAYEDQGLKALENVLGDIEEVLARRPVTAEADVALVRELGTLSRSLTRTVTLLET
jgi:hypothetical protein